MSAIQNLIAVIGECLSEQSNCEIDMNNFGKFSVINKYVKFSP
jgi:nucleoid DNA-binding protein